MVKVPFIKDRRDLREVLSQVIDKSEDIEELDLNKKLKTYVIESNAGADIRDIFNGSYLIKDTSDPTLKILNVHSGGKSVLSFYLDIEDNRFWKLHSLYDSSTTEQAIRGLVEKNFSKLDYLWLPSNLLEKYMAFGGNTGFTVKFKNKFIAKEKEDIIKDVSMRFWGGGAREVIDDLRNNPRLVKGITLSSIGINYKVEGGFSKESIANFGRFTLMKGNSVDSHFNIVQKIKESYSEKLKLLESKYRFMAEKKSVGIKLNGSPLYLDFTNPLEDIGQFSDKLVSSTNPFRLSGVKRMENKDLCRVFSIDLHTNDLLNLEITPNWMAIYLSNKSCGNVITRLVTNIQTHLNSQIKLVGSDNERII